MAEKQMNGGLLALIISVPVVLIILFVVVLPNRDDATDTSNTGGLTTVIDEDGNPIDVNNANNYAFIMPEDWYRYDNAIEDIQSLGEGQVIVPGIVQDPTDEDIYYFASTSTLSYEHNEPAEVLFSIYKYNAQDYSFERLYKKPHLYEQDFGLGAISSYQVVGYDSEKLILLEDIVGGFPLLPGCNELLYKIGKDFRIFSINIQDPYSGQEEYELPDDLKEQGEAEAGNCIR